MLTVAALVVGAISLGLVAAFPVVLDQLGLDTLGRSLGQCGSVGWPDLADRRDAGRVVPLRADRDHARWRWVSWGAAVAVVLWLAASAAFSLYVSHFSHYHETYGALAGVAILLLWLYLSSFIALLGAEINSEIEHQTAIDSTVGPRNRWDSGALWWPTPSAAGATTPNSRPGRSPPGTRA